MRDGELVRVLKALADATRFGIVQELAKHHELACSDIVDRFSLSQPTISHHLKLLADAGILVIRAEGKRHYASLNHATLSRLGDAIPARSIKRERRKKLAR